MTNTINNPSQKTIRKMRLIHKLRKQGLTWGQIPKHQDVGLDRSYCLALHRKYRQMKGGVLK